MSDRCETCLRLIPEEPIDPVLCRLCAKVRIKELEAKLEPLALATRFTIGNWFASATKPGNEGWSIGHPSRVVSLPYGRHNLTRGEALIYLRKLAKEE